MQFGRQDISILNNIDFKLPAEPAFNGEVLRGKPAAAPLVRLGATTWNRKDWLGGVFPKGTKEKDFLSEYSRHFDGVELNATHYKIYPPETIRGWAEKVHTPGFRFSPKMPQSISHYSNLVNARDQTDAFLESIRAFGGRLGPVFMQMSESFGPARKDLLFTYLAALPKDLPFFVELRHPDWFSDPHHSTALYHNLRTLGIGLVITDTAGRRDVVHMHLPVPRAMVRFVGNSLHPTDYQRADDWVNRLAYWLANGLETADIFIHMHDDTAVPEMAVYLGEKLEAATGLKIRKPDLRRENTLF